MYLLTRATNVFQLENEGTIFIQVENVEIIRNK